MPDGTWSLADAKAKLSEVVERAKTQGPQHLTKNGKDAAVVLSAEDYRRLSEAEANTPSRPPAGSILATAFSATKNTRDCSPVTRIPGG